jgi:hypothetical protein
VGVLASFLIRPVFVERYIEPGLLCLWIGCLIALIQNRRTNLKVYFSLVMLVVSLQNMISFSLEEYEYKKESASVADFQENSDHTVYITDDDKVWGIMNEMYGAPCYLWDGTLSACYEKVYDYTGCMNNVEEIAEVLNSGENVYFVQADSLTVEDLLEGTEMTYLYTGQYRASKTVEIYEIIK